jgi:aminopeptidase N
MNLLNDSLMLARGGEASLVDTLKLAMSCEKEPRDSVWTLVLRGIGYAQQLTDGDNQTEDAIKAAKGKLADYWSAKLGWDNRPNDDANTHQLRHTAIALMIASEDENAVQKGLDLYQNDITKIDAELRATILATAVKHGDKSVIDDLMKLYPEVGSDIQLDITSALTSTKDSVAAKHIISKALGADGFVRNQDLMRWIAMFVRNRYTREVMWNFIVSEWKWLEETMSGSKSFDYLPTYLASAMNSKDWQREYHDLFKKYEDNKVLARNIQVGYADIAARLSWRERDEQAIKDFFKDQSKK